MKTDKNKELLLECLRKIPIIQAACEKSGISRATYYRWIAKSKKFKQKTNEAIREGELLITEMTESQLISLVRDKNFSAIQLWLKTHHSKYSNKVEITGNLNLREEPLTPEQEKLVKKALKLAGLLENKQTQQKHE